MASCRTLVGNMRNTKVFRRSACARQLSAHMHRYFSGTSLRSNKWASAQMVLARFGLLLLCMDKL